MKSAMTKIVILLACVALVAGCGKFLGHASTAHKLTLAQESLAKAKAAGAETRAPADYYMAEEYLKKAEHEVQEGDREIAREWGEKSEQFSNAALQNAGGCKTDNRQPANDAQLRLIRFQLSVVSFRLAWVGTQNRSRLLPLARKGYAGMAIYISESAGLGMDGIVGGLILPITWSGVSCP